MDMFPLKIVASVIFLLLFHIVNCARFPSYIQKCHQSDPNVKNCYKRTTDLVKSHLSSGVPEFYLPPMSPLVLPEISLDSGNNFKALFKNLKIYDLDEAVVKDMDINLSTNRIKADLIVPYLRLMSTYSLQGKILFLQLNSHGSADGNITNAEVEVELQGTRYKKSGKEYLKFSEMKIKDKLHKPVFYFDGLFEDNPELTEQTNKIINENIDEIIDELRPAIHAAISKTVLGLISHMFEEFSVTDLFPE